MYERERGSTQPCHLKPRAGACGERHRRNRWTLSNLVLLVMILSSCTRPVERAGGGDDPGARLNPVASEAPGHEAGEAPSSSGKAESTGDRSSWTGTWLIAGVAPGEEANRVTVHPLLLKARELMVARRVDAVGHTTRNAGPVTAALAAGGESLVLARGRVVEWHRPFSPGAPVVEVNVEREPSALLLLGQRLYIGSRGRVDMVDLSAGQRLPVLVHEVPNLPKPIDFLLELGASRVVAVDDIVVPKVGIVFYQWPDDRLEFQFQGDLPAGPNEVYVDAAANDHRLFLLARFSTRAGYGHRLYRCEVVREEIQCQAWLEQVALRTGEATLVAGERYSDWEGLAVTGEDAFVCAGERGLLHLTGDRFEQVSPRDPCLDLIGDGVRMAVLEPGGPLPTARNGVRLGQSGNAADRSYLALIEWDPSSKRRISRWRYPVPRGVTRLQR